MKIRRYESVKSGESISVHESENSCTPVFLCILCILHILHTFCYPVFAILHSVITNLNWENVRYEQMYSCKNFTGEQMTAHNLYLSCVPGADGKIHPEGVVQHRRWRGLRIMYSLIVIEIWPKRHQNTLKTTITSTFNTFNAFLPQAPYPLTKSTPPKVKSWNRHWNPRPFAQGEYSTSRSSLQP